MPDSLSLPEIDLLPSWLKKIQEYLNPINTGEYMGGNPLGNESFLPESKQDALIGALTSAPLAAGLVLKNPKNAARLAKMMVDSDPNIRTASQAEQAVAFIKAKYPKLFNSIREVAVRERPLEGKSLTTTGFYNPDWRKIHIAKGEKIGSSVNTLGHELTHSIQDMRSNRVPRPEASSRFTLSGPGTGGSDPFHGYYGERTPYGIASDVFGYNNNPYEVQARQGGETALKALKTYLDLIKEPGIRQLFHGLKLDRPKIVP